MKNFTFKKYFALLIAFLGVIGFGYGQIITFDFGGNIGNEVSVVSNFNDVNLGASTITRGAGLTANNNANRFNAQNWALVNIANAVSGDNYMEFTITPNAGFEFNVTTININFQRSSTGVRGLSLRSSVDSYATDIDGEKSVADNTSTQTFSFNVAHSNNTTPVTYRFYGWAEATGGSGGFEGGGNDIVVNGSVIASCLSTSTWNGTIWVGGTPDLTTEVVLDASFNTATHGGSFSACNLTVNSSGTSPEYVLTVANGDYVQVQNNIIANGNINVRPRGAVVQIDDAAAVLGSGTITVTKTTAPANDWYEYTYWSSPVSGADIDNGLTDSYVNRRFSFNAQNFLDHCQETANNNICDDNGGSGLQDDIDDDGNDWQYINGSTLMIPGVGYASTHDPTLFAIGPGNQFDYTFEGPFNNGIITVPVYRNDSELNDYNWNFIGNPYPSAIDADLFLAANSEVSTSVSTTKSLNGAIFLWSQDTPPSGTANGNEQLNFSNDDYAIINAVGQNAGGDMVIPNRYIPSGQGFFVSYSDTAVPLSTSVNGDGHSIAQGEITFDNSMRVTNPSANSQFFKNSNSDKSKNSNAYNKLWVNLRSDNGVFNQILIGYVNGATNEDDGIAYDAHKYSTKGAAIYSIIQNSNKKFAIQGKAPSDLNENEIIDLGFKTAIDVPTVYTFSIAQFQGDFINNNPVFLIDNLLNKTHNLKVCDYNFTSEVGEFNTRFKIAFSDKALSTSDFGLNDNALKIIELDNDRVNFKLSDNFKIKSVTIFDLLGRPLYNLKGANSSETYQLSKLKNTVYIAKVELSNGTIITKKAVKK
ncbi:T9SS sorting signal type C domain-containing protein [Hwangdonia lutea]|uniref:T9SS sorting signal type C domain-containing protein n=1 Tax=Hwangdonia lutea TaxID=3075823 RepID=A0AA97HRG8_9FLAO|nr:T9SS sorting signal type C domain-containing protein [Hwangdonia sp. SCSIO 19198]WOD44896.1 T9SS sorting signal type C domain-containing protein [Hwangdonia sp. SCSIO 19198]